MPLEPKCLIYQVRCVQWILTWPVSLYEDAFWNLMHIDFKISILNKNLAWFFAIWLSIEIVLVRDFAAKTFFLIAYNMVIVGIP